MRRIITLALAALAAGFYLGTPTAAEATTPAPVPAAFSISWGTVTPTVTPAGKRRIEVVDQLKPTKWRVSQAAEWLDKYTASNMVTVSRCSGHAWKCVYVRGGKLGGNVLALTQGNRITVDTAKVDRHGYRSNLSREKILAHELAHSFGIVKHTNYTVMAAAIGKTRLSLNSTQRAFLRKR
jgi:hypothetical protein